MAPITSTNSNERHCATCKCSKPSNGGPLQCKNVSYCGRECQSQDWPSHKDACKAAKKVADTTYEAEIAKAFASMGRSIDPHPETKILSGEGIFITPFALPLATGGIGYEVRATLGLAPGSYNYPWSELPVSKVLGFPLRLIGTPKGDPTLPNEEAELLGIEPDPSSPRFGLSIFEGHAHGGVVVTRMDGRELHMDQLSALRKYIRKDLKGLHKVKGVEARKKLADKKLNPAAFAKAFERTKAKESAESEQARAIWKDVECPVKLV
ncbi:hypothetical protein LTR56_013106 [Elasticomyces elasticus]|nr:hypothetical protein LTR56_013106 [Elasticomyces elasticus]KAK3640285.1 hypothetical protein LTR22_017120 [Elasticomyces elasticus]KAK4920562.1 hypothetical protein LTR49_011977 [Elasticomyces elasticus]